MLHKVRLMLNRQLVMLTNAIRAHMAEFGIIAPVDRGGGDRLLAVIDDGTDGREGEVRGKLFLWAAAVGAHVARRAQRRYGMSSVT